MQLFYSQRIEGDTIYLDADETRHAISVLRKREGDTLQVMDGKGHLYEAQLINSGKKETQLQVITKTFYPERPKKLHIAIAPTKNTDRIEWFVEKSIEMGVDQISFLRCARSERKQINTDRIEKIALSAAKQSLSWHLPIIHPMLPFSSFVKENTESEVRWIAVCEGAEI